jgi:hypothetical protein
MTYMFYIPWLHYKEDVWLLLAVVILHILSIFILIVCVYVYIMPCTSLYISYLCAVCLYISVSMCISPIYLRREWLEAVGLHGGVAAGDGGRRRAAHCEWRRLPHTRQFYDR